MNIVIIDSIKKDLDSLHSHIIDWGKRNHFTLKIRKFYSGEDFFKNIDDYNNIDLIILDASLPKMSGIQVAINLRKKDFLNEILFITAKKSYIQQGYTVHAYNYLFKPFDGKVLNRCLHEIAKKKYTSNYYFKNINNELYILPYRNIISFCSNGHYIDISTSDKTFTQYMNISQLTLGLPCDFVRVHRSCIVNLNHISKIVKNRIYLSNGSTVSVGRCYQNQFNNVLTHYVNRFNYSY